MTLIGIALRRGWPCGQLPNAAGGGSGGGRGFGHLHPEASRIARLASGGRFGTAQSTFQVGGNTGSAIGLLLAGGHRHSPRAGGGGAVTGLIALAAIFVLYRLTLWVRRHGQAQARGLGQGRADGPGRAVVRAVMVICVLLFAKFVYIARFTNYFTFYLIQRFGLGVQHSQIFLFMFLASVAVGTFAGGPVGDRIGRKAVIGVFLGVAPFALALPHVGLFWTAVLAMRIGLVMSSAFAAMVVYAQEAVPGLVWDGLLGLMFGLMFGIGGSGGGSGEVADVHGIVWAYGVTAYLPLLGLVTALLPDTASTRHDGPPRPVARIRVDENRVDCAA